MSDSSEWTVGTLKQMVDQRFIDLEARTRDAKHSMERAEDAARATREYTEVKNNEFRAQLGDQAQTFMPRAEADQRYATTLQSIAELRGGHQKSLDDLRDVTRRAVDELRSSFQKAQDEVRRLVYIATGIALAAAVAIPLLIRH